MIKAKLQSITQDKMMFVQFKHRNIAKALDALNHITRKRKMKVTAIKF